jgi:hypothetical protein
LVFTKSQIVPGAVHWGVLDASLQQGCPTPPQVPQLPAAHAPRPCAHMLPAVMHMPSTQHPPASHVSPEQQTFPAVPHAGAIAPSREPPASDNPPTSANPPASVITPEASGGALEVSLAPSASPPSSASPARPPSPATPPSLPFSADPLVPQPIEAPESSHAAAPRTRITVLVIREIIRSEGATMVP